MPVKAHGVRVLFCILCILNSHAELPLPPSLLPLNTRAGALRLLNSKWKLDAYLLLQHFTTQINGAFCGPASASMVCEYYNLLC